MSDCESVEEKNISEEDLHQIGKRLAREKSEEFLKQALTKKETETNEIQEVSEEFEDSSNKNESSQKKNTVVMRKEQLKMEEKVELVTDEILQLILSDL